jgi:hypothetical protein
VQWLANALSSVATIPMLTRRTHGVTITCSAKSTAAETKALAACDVAFSAFRFIVQIPSWRGVDPV